MRLHCVQDKQILLKGYFRQKSSLTSFTQPHVIPNPDKNNRRCLAECPCCSFPYLYSFLDILLNISFCVPWNKLKKYVLFLRKLLNKLNNKSNKKSKSSTSHPTLVYQYVFGSCPVQQRQGEFHSSPLRPWTNILVAGCVERQPHLKPFNDYMPFLISCWTCTKLTCLQALTAQEWHI